MNKPSPFFIVGVGRSGTTLLRLMFHNHPNIAIPYESHFITDYYKRLDNYGDLQQNQNLKRLLEDIFNEELIQKWDHKFSIDAIIPEITERNLGAIFEAIYEDYATAKGKTRWGDKSDYLDRMHIINQLFPTAKFIHIIRDGRDVANSMMKLSWGPRDIIQAAESWNYYVILGRRMGQMLGPNRYAEVKYEDLVNDPHNELVRLCSFIDDDFSEQMLDYYKTSESSIPDDRKFQHYNSNQPPKSSRTFAWKLEMNQVKLDLYNNYALRALSELNYEIPQRKTPQIILLIVKFWIYFKRGIRSLS